MINASLELVQVLLPREVCEICCSKRFSMQASTLHFQMQVKSDFLSKFKRGAFAGFRFGEAAGIGGLPLVKFPNFGALSPLELEGRVRLLLSVAPRLFFCLELQICPAPKSARIFLAPPAFPRVWEPWAITWKKKRTRRECKILRWWRASAKRHPSNDRSCLLKARFFVKAGTTTPRQVLRKWCFLSCLRCESALLVTLSRAFQQQSGT